ncbi:RsmD family RNA methyltransferase [Lignipirellula cremea]|uniref:Ribosomal RNA small subunit methyltransferase D n=1 Tax=Lignipirellula cremea TaxID=2528010 RepID=A0A518DP03_9BACT|nr:RsmD family RNA methyltransferase [Lignipirellula cremea]QDU93564.1 Ribosomal RNA small subunit methyltransferase D [Lignipirellula cremea]
MTGPRRPSKKSPPQVKPAALRIIGGDYRRHKLLYNGDPATRPMKDRTREAVFNLIGPSIVGKHAFDLFAGTGALGLEAISRKAATATFIERNIPTAKVIEDNVAALKLGHRCRVIRNDAFYWTKHELDMPPEPWAIFCSPPYSLYVSQLESMVALLTGLLEVAPPDSLCVVEADERFDMTLLPHPEEWNIRTYRPAEVALYRKPAVNVE